MHYIIRFFLATFLMPYCMHSSQQEGIIIIVDYKEIPDIKNVMVENLKNALKYKFPIIASNNLVNSIEFENTEKEFKDLYPTWIEKHQGNFVLLIPQEKKDLLQKGLKLDLSNQKFKDVITDFKNIFKPKNEQIDPIEWVIYLNGHGSKDKTISGFSLEEFKQFLNFLNNDIKTDFLLYLTCYGGGCNRVFAYKDSVNNFPIVALGASDSITLSDSIKFDIFFDKFSLNGLYNRLRKAGFFTTDANGEKALEAANIPQILYPQSNKFVLLLDETHEILDLSDEALGGKKNTIEIFGATKVIALGDMHTCLNLIKRSGYEFPRVIVNSLSQKKYYFESITLENNGSGLEAFLSKLYDDKLSGEYTLFIKELTVSDREKNYQDVVITINKKTIDMKATYSKNNTLQANLYVYTGSKVLDKGPISLNYKDKYQSDFKECKTINNNENLGALFAQFTKSITDLYLATKFI